MIQLQNKVGINGHVVESSNWDRLMAGPQNGQIFTRSYCLFNILTRTGKLELAKWPLDGKTKDWLIINVLRHKFKLRAVQRGSLLIDPSLDKSINTKQSQVPTLISSD